MVDEVTDRIDGDGTVCGEEAVVSDFHKPIGQDMLEETAYELQDIKGGSEIEVGAVLSILEGDGVVFHFEDAVIRDGDFEDVGGEVLERGVAFTDGLGVNVPVQRPHLGVDLLKESGFFHGVTELGAVDGGEGFDRDVEVLRGGEPAGAIPARAAARDDVVDVGMILELTAPGLEHAEEACQIGADKAVVFGQQLQGLGGGLKQGVVGGFCVGADEVPQLLRHGKSDQEIVCGEASGHLLGEPLLGFMVLAVGAVPIAAGALDEMALVAGSAEVEGKAELTASAVGDGLDDFSVFVGDALAVALEVLGCELREDLFDGAHAPNLPMA